MQTSNNNKKSFAVLNRASASFKSLSRQKNPAWGNRFVKDHNDLQYQSISKTIQAALSKKLIETPSKNKHQLEANGKAFHFQKNKYSYSPRKFQCKTSQATRTNCIKIENYIKKVEEIETKKFREDIQQTATSTAKKQRRKYRFPDENQQEVDDYGLKSKRDENDRELVGQCISPQKQKKQINSLGLSKYEFSKTIVGKMQEKTNYHIDLSKNKTFKIKNMNKIWYDSPKNIEKESKIIQKQKFKQLKKVHDFKSYSAHKLFEKGNRSQEDNNCGWGGMLDKFYDVDNPNTYQLTHEKVPDTVDYYAMTARPGLPKRLGTHLIYKVNEDGMGNGNNKRPILSLVQSEKKLIFSRQVISPTRGCYR